LSITVLPIPLIESVLPPYDGIFEINPPIGFKTLSLIFLAAS